MASFANGEVEIAYLDEGDGEPIVLVHGFASTKEVNWVHPGWVATLTRAGRRVIALDNRGHGASSKLYDPAAYHSATMADDVRALLDHLKIERADVMGYSMGARITAFLAVKHPGARAFGNSRRARHPAGRRRRPAGKHRRGAGGAVARRCARPDRPHVPRPLPIRPNRTCARSPPASAARGRRSAEQRSPAIRAPVLVAVGTKDQVAGSAQELAALIPGARALDIPDRDHMLAVGDKVFKAGVIDFLNQRG